MNLLRLFCQLVGALGLAILTTSPALAQKRPNVVMLMSGDVGWADYGVYTGGAALGQNGYQTFFSGKWHLGDVPKFHPIEHGFDEMKQFTAYYPGVYAYEDTAQNGHPLRSWKGDSHA